MDDSPLKFAAESSIRDDARLNETWKVMVIDDEHSIHDITSLALREFTYEGRGVRFINAFSAAEAKDCLMLHPDTALMLVDVVMESEDAGLKLVHYVREELGNHLVQVVIRTGQPGFAPEDQVISKYRINSYFSKTEVTSQKLVSLVTTSLRTYQLSLELKQELARRKKAETKLLELNRGLEEKIRDRTRALSLANRHKSEFLANMSHEIRTPMNGIISMAALLMEESLTDRQEEFARIIHASANTLMALINDILDLSKIEAGHLRFEHRPFSMKKVLYDVMAMFRVKADEKGLKLKSALEKKFPDLLVGDELRVKQILINLVGNAVKFTDSGRIDVGVSVEKVLSGHVFLSIEVMDTGPGIDEAFKSRLFDTFSQQDASTTRKYGGTGLGLAITRQLAVMMDGDVGARNREGAGAAFKVRLKMETGKERRSAPRETIDDGKRLVALQKRIAAMSPRVLVAEDNPTNQKVICLLLEKLGLLPKVVENGHEVMAALGRCHYDVLLMDVQMPGLDGIGATRRIRDAAMPEPVRQIPIIGLTALAMPEDRKACIKAGMDQVVTKPIHPPNLTRAIASALDIHS